MSDQPIQPPDAGSTAYLFTLRGTPKPASLDATAKVHNSTAGTPPAITAARSFGDLSHNVFSAVDGPEILIVDFWNSLTGLGQFFSTPDVQAGAGMLFSESDATVWAPTTGYGDFHLLAPSQTPVSAVGILRVNVTSFDAAAVAFNRYAAATMNEARLHGIVSHSTWTRVPNPGEPPTIEVLGVDFWLDAKDMGAYYDRGLGFDVLGPVFAGPPATSLWNEAPGEWSEW
jgi:hypothetical protein